MTKLNRPTLLLRGCSRAVEAVTLFFILANLGTAAAASVRVQGDVAAVRIEASQAPVRDVLDGLAANFGIRYRSSIALDDVRSGTYSGSLRQVLSRVLDGYNFVTAGAGSALQIIILGKPGGDAVPAAVQPVGAVKNPATDWRPRR